MVEYKY